MKISLIPNLEAIVKDKKTIDPWRNFLSQITSAINQGQPVGEIKSLFPIIGLILTPSLRSSLIRVKSGTGGGCSIIANPQVSYGFDGQELTIEGTDAVDTVTFSNGNGLQLQGANPITLGLGDVIKLQFNKVRNVWVENYRSINH